MRFFITILMLLAIASPTIAQNTTTLTEEQVSAYEERVKQLVSFLQFSMNTLGDARTPARDKQVIINESYLKAFRDGNVQIEDDLVEKREVVTNKNVQAYLKDIDFFFKEVAFSLDVEAVEHYVGDDGQIFFKVVLNRNIEGTTVDGNEVSGNRPRFIEVNLDQEENDLKIVSIYTTKLSQQEELENWWQGISYEWAAYFKSRFKVYQDPNFNDLKKIARVDSINLEGNKFIEDLSALSRLTNLRYLNISNTAITDLAGVRNNTKLRKLEMSNSLVKELKHLKYATELEELNLSKTQIIDFDHLTTFKELKKLNCAGSNLLRSKYLKELTQLKELDASNSGLKEITSFGALTKLENLNISDNAIVDISPLSILTMLKTINLEGTNVASLDALKNVKNLMLLYANGTKVSSLSPLKDIQKLQRVYADDSNISLEAANKFMNEHGSALVVSGSQNLESWWSGLSSDWKGILAKQAKVAINPSKEDLVGITNVKKLDFSGNQYVRSLEPLDQLWNLKEVNLSGTLISDLLSLENLRTLEVLNCANSKVNSLAPLNSLKKLKKLNVDNCPINESTITSFQAKHPECLVIFRSVALKKLVV